MSLQISFRSASRTSSLSILVDHLRSAFQHTHDVQSTFKYKIPSINSPWSTVCLKSGISIFLGLGSTQNTILQILPTYDLFYLLDSRPSAVLKACGKALICVYKIHVVFFNYHRFALHVIEDQMVSEKSHEQVRFLLENVL